MKIPEWAGALGTPVAAASQQHCSPLGSDPASTAGRVVTLLCGVAVGAMGSDT